MNFPNSVLHEVLRLANVSTKVSAKISFKTLNTFINQTGLDSEPFLTQWQKQLRSELVQGCAELGPLYIKLLQILLSQDQSFDWVKKNFQLETLLKNLPALDFSEIEHILDEEIPDWRIELKVDPIPIGSASIGQVYKAKDRDGNEWAVKILKPQAARRLRESCDAFLNLTKTLKKVAFNFTQKKILRETELFFSQLRHEASFLRERDNIKKATTLLANSKSDLIAVPKLLEKFCTDRVVVMEYFEGFSVVDVLTKKVQLRAKNQKELAHDLLSELLVQIFELGFFHADPHAGNIMILKRGGIGLFDWGLVGQFEENERLFIAAVLKSILTLDKEKLVQAILELVHHQGQKKVTFAKVQKEVDHVIAETKKGNGKEKPIKSLGQAIEICVLAAERLKVSLPEGLILMIKTLITVEGLTKNIDSDISMLHAAIPVLLRTAKPSSSDFLKLLWKSPRFLKKII